ncbi:basic amino acid ABC transporter substrate-binding protein [Coprothermobacter platensis]|uniref:basic amino acid ABC transporter substrate-binding protein n=1 Tax=Coprothermobacter platensis TaxID=108819 RepID=UPI0003643571|nr:basic amino acid ABC transporter substrate-binding protein [Coprothermobacter platensis]
MKRVFTLLLVVGLILVGCGGQKTSNTLSVGTSADFPPLESIDENGNFVGFDIDLMNAIAKQMGYTVKWENSDFAGLVASVQTGKYDAVISGMTITASRQEEVDFSDPYFRSDQAVVVQNSNTTIKSQADLADKKIGVQLGTTGEMLARKLVNANGKVFTYDSPDQAFLDLNTGRLDAVVNDLPVSSYFLEKNSNLPLHIAFDIPTDEYYGIAVKKGNTDLVTKINKALAELKSDGEYAKLYKSWFGQEPPTQ